MDDIKKLAVLELWDKIPQKIKLSLALLVIGISLYPALIWKQNNRVGEIFGIGLNYITDILMVISMAVFGILAVCVPFLELIRTAVSKSSLIEICKVIFKNPADKLTLKEMRTKFKKYIPTRYSEHEMWGRTLDSGVDNNYINSQLESHRQLITQLMNAIFETSGIKYIYCYGECGSGKTTLLKNLVRVLVKKRGYSKEFKILYLDGMNEKEELLQKIIETDEKSKTVLLFDAFDESPAANKDARQFWQDLRKASKEYLKVVITCRTHFFESAKKLPEGEYIRTPADRVENDTYKYFITPFSDRDVKNYINRFPRAKRKEAYRILKSCPDIKRHPLILSFIEELEKEYKEINNMLDVYQKIIEKWVTRNYQDEAVSTTSRRKLRREEFKALCFELAKFMCIEQVNKDKPLGVKIEDFDGNKAMQDFLKAVQANIKLQGHPLLTRNAEGVYVFTHRSIWEFLAAWQLMTDEVFFNQINWHYKGMNEVLSLFLEMVRENFEGNGQKAKELMRGGKELIAFGKYKWRVLAEDKEAGKKLLLCDTVIEKRPYNDDWAEITWETCTLRKYLNNEFYSGLAFSDEDRNRIALTDNLNHDNERYGTKGGNNTKDNIFLLSLQETLAYFGDGNDFNNKENIEFFYISDRYNIKRMVLDSSNAVCWCWLRSPGYDSHNAAHISVVGVVHNSGSYVSNDRGGVRPALWLNLKS